MTGAPGKCGTLTASHTGMRQHHTYTLSSHPLTSLHTSTACRVCFVCNATEAVRKRRWLIARFSRACDFFFITHVRTHVENPEMTGSQWPHTRRLPMQDPGCQTRSADSCVLDALCGLLRRACAERSASTTRSAACSRSTARTPSVHSESM